MRSIRDEEHSLFLGEGCPLHGDEAMRECGQCGVEFCQRCNPRRHLCPECQLDLDEDEDEKDFDDVDDLDALLSDQDTDLPVVGDEDDELDLDADLDEEDERP